MKLRLPNTKVLVENNDCALSFCSSSPTLYPKGERREAKTPSPYKGGARNTKPAYPSGTSSTNAGYQTFSLRRQALLVWQYPRRVLRQNWDAPRSNSISAIATIEGSYEGLEFYLDFGITISAAAIALIHANPVHIIITSPKVSAKDSLIAVSTAWRFSGLTPASIDV